MKSQPSDYLKSVSFLRRSEKNNIETLKEKFCINGKAHKKYENLVQLSYSQIRSPFENPIVQESRNLVLDTKDNFNVVCWGFKKFFNYAEPNAEKLDWENQSVKVYEKIDGSIIVLYFYNNEWNFSSGTLPDASGNLNDNQKKSFKHLFQRTWDQLHYRYPGKEDRDKYFIFECFTRENVIVVREHERGDEIILLGVRNGRTLNEEFPEPYAKKYKWSMAPCYSPDEFSTLDDVIRATRTLDPMKHEGFVCVESGHFQRYGNCFKRVKVKSPSYVSIQKLRLRNPNSLKTKELNTRRIFTVIQTNDHDEFLSYFPSFRSLYLEKKKTFDQFVDYLHRKIIDHSSNYDQFIQEICEDLNILTKTKIQKLKKCFSFDSFWSSSSFDSSSSLREFLSFVDIRNLEICLLPFETKYIKKKRN